VWRRGFKIPTVFLVYGGAREMASKEGFKWRTEGRDGCLPTRTTHLLHKAYLRANDDFAHEQQDDERLLDLFARIKQSLWEFKKEMIVPDEIGGEGERVVRRKINI
jgi:hypothetical protein